MKNHWGLLEQLAATLAAYLAAQLVRRIHIERQVARAMREIEREFS